MQFYSRKISKIYSLKLLKIITLLIHYNTSIYANLEYWDFFNFIRILQKKFRILLIQIETDRQKIRQFLPSIQGVPKMSTNPKNSVKTIIHIG